MTSPFATPAWLAQHLNDPGLVVIDASWHMPNSARNAQAEYLDGHIPGAVFFDIDGIADTDTDLPHMLPSPADFARAVGALGISEDMTIVVYDEIGLFSAPARLVDISRLWRQRCAHSRGRRPQMARRAPPHRDGIG